MMTMMMRMKGVHSSAATLNMEHNSDDDIEKNGAIVVVHDGSTAMTSCLLLPAPGVVQVPSSSSSSISNAHRKSRQGLNHHPLLKWQCCCNCRITLRHCIGFIFCSVITLITIMTATHHVDIAQLGMHTTHKQKQKRHSVVLMKAPQQLDVADVSSSWNDAVTAEDDETMHQPIRTLPKWGTTVLEEDIYGISFLPLLNFIQTSSRYPYHKKYGTYYRPTTDHSKESQTVLPLLPETLYMIQPSTAKRVSSSSTVDRDIATVAVLPPPPPPTLYSSHLHRRHHGPAVAMGNETLQWRHKLNHTERLMLTALQTLHQEVLGIIEQQQTTKQTSSARTGEDDDESHSVCSHSQWPSLCRNLYPIYGGGDGGGGGGFPFLAWYGDYTGCNYHNWQQLVTSNTGSTETTTTTTMEPIPQNLISTRETINVSIPLFTVAAQSHTACNNAVPFPNFYQILGSAEHSHRWDTIIHQYNTQYPWDTKTNKIVWRGSLSGRIDNNITKCPRWRMVQTIYQIETQRRERELARKQQNQGNTILPVDGNITTIDQSDSSSLLSVSDYDELFDVKITFVPLKQYQPQLEADIGNVPITHSRLLFEDFQKYRAIIDIDGHSWSGRFGSLLCFNSVILKVDPTYVEYFYERQPNDSKNNKDNYRLQAWKHYIPIRDDFSNIEAMAEFVLDPMNDNLIHDIVHNANDWCRNNMITSAIANDMLYVWDRYIELLNNNDAHWNERHWTDHVQAELLNDEHLDMISLRISDYPIPEFHALN